MQGVKVSEELTEQILLWVADRVPQRDVAVRAGVCLTTVSRLVKADRMSKQQHVPKPRAGSLTLKDRVDILIGIRGCETDAAIARTINFSRGTVGREIKRNGGRDSYDPTAAQEVADGNKKRPRPSWIETRPWLWDAVVDLLRLRWSPEQISESLRILHRGDPEWSVSYESIYEAIYVQAKPELRKELVKCLRTKRAHRVPQGRTKQGGNPPIKDMINISERPAEANDRAVPGHWEGDLIIGANGGSAVATLVERATRFGILIKIDSKDAVHVAERISDVINTLKDRLKRSLTWDCGSELAEHKAITTNTDMPVYFCDPRKPWQRGSNENWNGLVSQFLPKGTDLSIHSQEDLDVIAHLLNTRPRKTLDWQNPAERFNQLVAPTT